MSEKNIWNETFQEMGKLMEEPNPDYSKSLEKLSQLLDKSVQAGPQQDNWDLIVQIKDNIPVLLEKLGVTIWPDPFIKLIMGTCDDDLQAIKSFLEPTPYQPVIMNGGNGEEHLKIIKKSRSVVYPEPPYPMPN